MMNSECCAYANMHMLVIFISISLSCNKKLNEQPHLLALCCCCKSLYSLFVICRFLYVFCLFTTSKQTKNPRHPSPYSPYPNPTNPYYTQTPQPSSKHTKNPRHPSPYSPYPNPTNPYYTPNPQPTPKHTKTHSIPHPRDQIVGEDYCLGCRKTVTGGRVPFLQRKRLF